MNTLNSVYKYIEIRYADPICSIDLNEKALLFGTMMGRSIYFSLPDKTNIQSLQVVYRQHIHFIPSILL